MRNMSLLRLKTPLYYNPHTMLHILYKNSNHFLILTSYIFKILEIYLNKIKTESQKQFPKAKSLEELFLLLFINCFQIIKVTAVYWYWYTLLRITHIAQVSNKYKLRNLSLQLIITNWIQNKKMFDLVSVYIITADKHWAHLTYLLSFRWISLVNLWNNWKHFKCSTLN